MGEETEEYAARVAWLRREVDAAAKLRAAAYIREREAVNRLNAALIEKAPVQLGGTIKDEMGRIFRVTQVLPDSYGGWKVWGVHIKKDGSLGLVSNIWRRWEVIEPAPTTQGEA